MNASTVRPTESAQIGKIHTFRMTLFFRFLLVLAGTAILSTAFALVVQYMTLSKDLQAAGVARLQASASAVDRLVTNHLEETRVRFEAISRTPQFRANLETEDAPTLAFFAEELRRQNQATRVLFQDSEGREVTASGYEALDSRANSAGNAGLITDGVGAFSAVSIPLRTGLRDLGRLIVVEPLPETTLREWASICGAQVMFRLPMPVEEGALRETVRYLDDLNLCVQIPMEAELHALQRARYNLLLAGALAAFVGILASLLLSRTLASPVLQIRRAALELGRQNFARRIGSERADEIGELARSIDALADSLEQHEEDMRRRNQELIEINEELRIARDQSEAASSAKSEFLANISHELRTPMHGILSFSSFGLDQPETANPKKIRIFFEKIHQSGHRLLGLLNDLLDLSKMDAAKAPLSVANTKLDMIVDSVMDELSGLISQENVEVQFSERVDACLRLDKLRLMQVVRNLLGNAIKFSPPHSVIDIKMSQEPDHVRISFEDHGPGIPSDELEAIFDRFVQSSRTKTGAGGTGLGLSICREIMRLHEGHIWAENRAAGGARFVIEFPRIGAAAEVVEPAETTAC